MSQIQVAFFQENLNDTVVSINNQGYGGTITVSAFPDQYPFTWLQADPDGVLDLCTTIDSQQGSIQASFKRDDNSIYTVTSNAFPGPRPPRRPH